MLHVKQLTVGYGEADIVKGISFTVSANESLCILGPNGCGKTTMLKAIAGLLPYKGEITLNGKPLKDLGSKEAARRIALLSQQSALTFSYSVAETVMMGRYAHIRDGLWGRPSAEDHAMVERCLEAVDLLPLRMREISRLSGGQLQRVFLARALAQAPDIILLDEPTNHLDLKYQVELIDYLSRWRQEEGKSVIGVLHDISLAMRLADRVMLMTDGSAYTIGKTSDALTPAALKAVFQTDVASYMLQTLKMWESICQT